MKPTEAAVSIFLAIIGVAMIALLLSRRSNTAGILSSIGGSFSGILCKALSPITGNSCGGKLTPNVTTAISFGSEVQ